MDSSKTARGRDTLDPPYWYFNDETPHTTGGANTFARGCPRLQRAVLAVCIARFALATTTIYGEPGLETRQRR